MVLNQCFFYFVVASLSADTNQSKINLRKNRNMIYK